MSVAEGWRNFDSSFTLRFERIPVIGKLYTKNEARFPTTVEYGDIVRGLPVGENSCRGVYASHMLEHLALNEFRKAIRNTYRILNQEGIFRLVVPDLAALVKCYLMESDTNDQAALNFMSYSGLGTEYGQKGVKAAVKMWLGSPPHRWMWDEKSMSHELKKAGFSQIRRCSFNDCADPMFKLVEEPGRWEYEPLALEVRK
jgi:ubiquinone/menaquinone biosynthesis C-methylase UbiE